MVQRRKTPGISRSEKSKEIAERILNTSLVLLGEYGADGLTMSKIAAAAELSNGPLYGRYDTPEDIIIDLWEHRLVPYLNETFDLLSEWYQGDLPNPPSEILQALVNPPLEAKGAIEVLAVIRRFPYASEIVGSQFTELIDRYLEQQTEKPVALVLGQLTVFFGAILLSPVLAHDSEESWAEIMRILRSWTRRKDITSEPRRDFAPPETPLPKADTGDELLDAFVDATILVVAQTGFEKATAHRIARAAGRSFSSAYAQFETKDDLMIYAITSMVNKIISISVFGFIGLTREQYVDNGVAVCLSLCDEQFRLPRNLRLEIVVAARHHENLRTALLETFENSIEAIAVEIRNTYGIEVKKALENAMLLWHLIRANGFGMSLLSSSSPVMRDVDWAPGAAGVYEIAYELILQHLEQA